MWFPLFVPIIAYTLTIASPNMKSFKNFILEMLEEPPVKVEQTPPRRPMGEGGLGQQKAKVRVEGEPETKKPEEPKKQEKPAEDDPFGGNDQIRKMYGAIVASEHTASKVKDPFTYDERLYIRTQDKSGKSSAYGPLQIVRNTARGFFRNNPELFKGNEEYAKKFIEQGDKFLKAGKSNDELYGPGCVGDLCGEEHHANYQKLGAAIIRGKAKELKIDLEKPMSEQDTNRFVEYWRGVSEKEDPRYFREFRAAFTPKAPAPAPAPISPKK